MARKGEDGTNLFASESTWPFLLRQAELKECIEYFSEGDCCAPKVLRIFGASGTGKSFFAKELLVSVTELNFYSTAIYLNIPQTGFESSNLAGNINRLINSPRKAERSTASHVDKQLSAKWLKKKQISKSWTQYSYHVARGLVGQIPCAGPFIQAFLPVSVAQNTERQNFALRFLIDESRTNAVLFVFDNIQFLPLPSLEILETEFAAAGKKIQVVIIERTDDGARLDWTPLMPNQSVKDITFGRISCSDVETLVEHVFPSEIKRRELSETIARRSEGNLKSVWFQLKFLYLRRGEQEGDLKPETYEEVIQTLHQIDKVVLRLVTILLGGITVAHIFRIFEISSLHIDKNSITGSISDLVAIGLLVINSENNDKVRVEHEIVSRLVNDHTPEEEKLELRNHIVNALCISLNRQQKNPKDDVLYDRLIGLATEHEFRHNPKIQSLVIEFIDEQHRKEMFSYLATIFQDTVCWEVLDILPAFTVRCLLDALQKCSLFSFGLMAVEKLKRTTAHISLALLYEAKYLVQLFRYDEAEAALSGVESSPEKFVVEFNISLNLCENQNARNIALTVSERINGSKASEYEFLILRNSGHLFDYHKAKDVLGIALNGFKGIGSDFGVATTLNNIGVVHAVSGHIDLAKKNFVKAQTMLSNLSSNEVYQPLVNLCCLMIIEKNYSKAKKYLVKAKENLPRLLAMDSIMINFNEVVISFLSKEISINEIYSKVKELHLSAQQTKDMRFISVIAWFLRQLSDYLGDDNDIAYSEELIGYVLDKHFAGIELFVSSNINGNTITIPVFMSPHWRH